MLEFTQLTLMVDFIFNFRDLENKAKVVYVLMKGKLFRINRDYLSKWNLKNWSALEHTLECSCCIHLRSYIGGLVLCQPCCQIKEIWMRSLQSTVKSDSDD